MNRGDVILLSGDTGFSEGAHLHFGVYDCDCTTSSKQLDPFGWWSTSTSDVWPYADNHYLWTTSLPSFALISTTTGTISSDTVWRGNILVDGTVTINAGVTLTIDGAIVKFKEATQRTRSLEMKYKPQMKEDALLIYQQIINTFNFMTD